MLDLKKFKLKDIDPESAQSVQIERVSNRDIAIIGMACRFAKAEEPAEFWENLRQGLDLVRPLPDARKADLDAYLVSKGMDIGEIEYSEIAYMEDVDKFDPAFFRISPKEASLMDPNQRIFLQTAWRAIEDAGYGGRKLSGTETGIYMGFSSDFGYDYKRLVSEWEPEASSIATAGNIKSIIASRIAYILDLKGPSMVVDTACSSSLTAIHLACSALRNGECTTALAGSVKVHLIALQGKESRGIGIQSSNGRARTFDDSSDGTGSGEGCGVLVLKPLKKAMEDGDAIYAVVKGSAVNQDGSSIGITAPNAPAQAAVIEKAWKDAAIDPETITYIEAHGTGTKLGDPIEIDGITRAFQKYTRKKQFCGVGAVKTNIGHLDHAAGMAGLMKTILSLHHQTLPPTLHFRNPNTRIDFADSPVYVVDSLRDWRQPEGVPRRAGVSAFGLSGTNAHVILEEAPAQARQSLAKPVGPYLLTLSAQTREGLGELVEQYRRFCAEPADPDPASLCYTANTGRGQYACRIALVLSDLSECRAKLAELEPGESTPNGTYFGDIKGVREEEIKEHSRQAAARLREWNPEEPRRTVLEELAALYLQGASIDWEELYRGLTIRKLHLPTYPFERKRCWLNIPAPGATVSGGAASFGRLHPLLERIQEQSSAGAVFVTRFSPEKHWVLSEHKVNGSCVVPGVSYLEMAREAGRLFYPENALRLTDVIFISPLIVNAGESKEVQTIVKTCGDHLELSVVSEDGLIKHAEAKIHPLETQVHTYSLDELKARQKEHHQVEYRPEDRLRGAAIETGPRWRNLREFFIGEDEVLAFLEIGSEFHSDLAEFVLHPSLMDMAVNAVSQHVGEGLYLPFSYKNLKIYGPTPDHFYSYIRFKPRSANQEIVLFDLSLIDSSGRVFAEAEDYAIKKVRAVGDKFKDLAGRSMYYDFRWVASPAAEEAANLPSGPVLLFKDQAGYAARLAALLREMGRTVIEVEAGSTYTSEGELSYTVGTEEEDYLQLIRAIRDRKPAGIFHLWTMGEKAAAGLDALTAQEERSLTSIFHLTKALINEKAAQNLPLVLVTDQAHQITAEDEAPNPLHAAYLSFGKVIGQEYSALKVTCLDLDLTTDPRMILHGMNSGTGAEIAAYRQNLRYLPEFNKVEMTTLPHREISFHPTGVYLITGGTGGLGLELAQYIAGQAKANIALVSRSGLPGWERRDDIAAETDDPRHYRKLAKIRAMEAAGAKIEVIRADAANPAEMAAVAADLRTRYGRIRGVIHGAGVAGDGFLLRKQDSAFHAVLDPKIRGTWILDRITREDEPDFFVLMSSINAITGGQGQSDYTAANAYLDAYAEMSRAEGRRIVSINWPAWTEVGMAADHGVGGGVFGSVTPERGMELFAEILQKELYRVVIGEINYNLIARNEVILPFALSPELVAAVRNRQNRLKTAAPQPRTMQKGKEVVMQGREEAEYNPTEWKVARIWGEVLGLETVDIDENFNDLGGDSILATYLLKQMEEAFPGLVDISDIFTYSTVSAMAQYINGKTETKTASILENPEEKTADAGAVIDLDDLDSILDQLERGSLTAGDAEKMTVRRGNA